MTHESSAFQQAMTPAELNAWASSARRGERIVYHTGDIAYEADVEWRKPTDAEREYAAAVAALQQAAWALYEKRRVTLVQRRTTEQMQIRTVKQTQGVRGPAREYLAIRI